MEKDWPLPLCANRVGDLASCLTEQDDNKSCNIFNFLLIVVGCFVSPTASSEYKNRAMKGRRYDAGGALLILPEQHMLGRTRMFPNCGTLDYDIIFRENVVFINK